MPFVPGHEVVGELLDDCEDLPAGTRVVIDPVLTCAARGVEPCDACATGATNRCDRITVGHLAPGLQTGFCADTGGGWGEAADRPPQPAARRARGLLRRAGRAGRAAGLRRAHRAAGAGRRRTTACWSAVPARSACSRRWRCASLTGAGEITVVAKHGHQRELALALGATEVVAPDEVLRRRAAGRRGAFQAQARALRPAYLLGGVDVAVDAVGSKQSLETALHATRAGGRVVLSGMPAGGRPVRRRGSASSRSSAPTRRRSASRADGRSAFDVATELAGRRRRRQLAKIVGARYPLHRWREALDHAQSAGRLGTVKVAFDPEQEVRQTE